MITFEQMRDRHARYLAMRQWNKDLVDKEGSRFQITDFEVSNIVETRVGWRAAVTSLDFPDLEVFIRFHTNTRRYQAHIRNATSKEPF